MKTPQYFQIGMLALLIAVLNTLPSDADSRVRVNTSQLTMSGDELVHAVAGRPSPEAFRNYNGDFNSYWANAQSSAAGKTFEAMIMEADNASFMATGQSHRLIATAAGGQSGHPADLQLLDGRGKVVAQYQCKLGWHQAHLAVTDPKYATMRIVTTKDAMDVIRQELSKEEAKAARRGLALANEWQQTKRAIESGRLMKTTPAGIPLPSRQGVIDRARSVTARSWSQMGRTTTTAAPLRSALIVSAEDSSRLSGLLKNPALSAGTLVAGIDGVRAYVEFSDGSINKTELQTRLQEAVIKGVAVGGGTHLLYLVTATPHGLVVAGVAILTYEASSRLLAYLQAEHDRQFVALDDLRGRVPDSFLNALPRSLADARDDAKKITLERLEMVR